MILILVAIVVLFLASCILIGIGLDKDGIVHFAMFIVGFFGVIAAVVLSFAYAALGFNYFAAEHKAAIINREYGTQYTQMEVFYAKDVIDIVRQIDRKRMEINGNLLRCDGGE